MIVWLVLGLLAVTGAAAWWQPAPWRGFVIATCLEPVVGLVALPCLVVAAVEHRWPAVAVAALLVASHLAFTVPTMHPWRSAAPATGDWRLTVYSHNVLYTNADLARVARQVAQHTPDVVAIVELSDANVASLANAPEMAGYHQIQLRPHEAGRGLGVWSRLPMTDADVWQAPGYQQFQAVLNPPGQLPLTLIVVHAEAPVSPHRARTWQADLSMFADRVRAASRHGGVLLVGDFNATPTMRALGPIRATGVLDAATTTGNGWRATWPASHPLMPRVMRIDHVLHSPDLTATSYQLGAAAGSDHRPVIVALGRA